MCIHNSTRRTRSDMMNEDDELNNKDDDPYYHEDDDDSYETQEDDDDDDDETSDDGQPMTRWENNNADDVGFSFRLYHLAFIVLALWTTSQLLLIRQCVVASTKQQMIGPLIRKWHVTTKHKWLEILASPKTSSSVKAEVAPHAIITTYGNGTSDYHFVLEPHVGFLPKISDTSGMEYLEEESAAVTQPHGFCPILYEGWLPTNKGEVGTSKRYTYAPTTLVISQQLWNACQVFSLYLLICLLYITFTTSNGNSNNDGRLCEYYKGHNSNRDPASVMLQVFTAPIKKMMIGLNAVVSICILPFSVYVVSPGGHVFACLVFMNLLYAFFVVQPNHLLQISVGERQNLNASTTTNNNNRSSQDTSSSSSTTWTLTREETLACICNLGSSLYNYAGSIRVWPHWKRQMYRLDAYMGWPDEGDCTVNTDYTMGLDGVYMPLFVSRSTGTTTGAQVFWLVWSVLPFLYVSYFMTMFVLAKKSPGTLIQRILCTYGMLHFLFGTDVVAYRYGRGYHSYRGASSFFHWVEKGAWRIAMLMPIYQNCTNGHWEHGHRRFPIVGKILRGVLICWSVWFFCFQLIQSDAFKFTQYMMGEHQHGLLDILGLQHEPILKHWTYPYRFALVTMWSMYGLLHVTGFTLFRITLDARPLRRKNRSNSFMSDEEGVALLFTKEDDDDDDTMEDEDDGYM